MCPHIHLGTRQTRMTPFLPQALHPMCHRDMELWDVGQSPNVWTPQKLFPLLEFEPKVLSHAACSTAATMTDLSQLPSTLLLPNIYHSCYND